MICKHILKIRFLNKPEVIFLRTNCFKHLNTTSSICYILTLDRAVNQRCTCVNKRKKKRKQMGIMKEYRQMPAAVELVGPRKDRVRASLQTEGCGSQRLPVEQLLAKMRKKC